MKLARGGGDLKLARGGGDLKLAGTWHPGMEDELVELRSFACARCWRVKGFSLLRGRGWNEFITHVSGGLLYGREVKKPEWLREVRKNREGRRVEAECVVSPTPCPSPKGRGFELEEQLGGCPVERGSDIRACV